MTEAQRFALDRPCFLAGETCHPQFRFAKWPVSVVLTVNAGYE